MNVAQETLSIIETVALSTNGLLPLEVYKKLFDLGKTSGGGTFVEIGTAHAAATITLALGAIEGRKPFHIYTADPFSGKYSSRSKFGTVSDNVNFVSRQLKKFGVSDHVTIVIGGSEDILHDHKLSDINILILDADGRIDRDLAVLVAHLSRSCQIVVDDIDDNVYVTDKVIDQKHRITHLLVESFSAANILKTQSILQSTGFFVLGPKKTTGQEIITCALPAYRELVFADTPKQRQPPSQTQKARNWIATNIPFARWAYQTLRRR